ncbi:hypothetical protein [Streptomyces sp. CRN 30]|uniref:hypothetical protein n=1 Tax=Streptomyces sp. CRN 30 TaxID=3075613 RepID=UPI002A83D9FF|nr:hypothetical protein [Streptomyces sp. CRN 30]
MAAVLMGVVSLLGWSAPAASAGGPTAVVLVSPESEATASLHAFHDDYRALERLLGPLEGGERTGPPDAGRPFAQVDVMWLRYDGSPWRVDRVYPLLDAAQVWIHTTPGASGRAEGHWHRAERPQGLRALLERLGVLGAADAGAGPADAEDGPWLTGWWWAAAGAVAGAVLALGLRPYAGRLRRGPRPRPREDGPRQELIDL